MPNAFKLLSFPVFMLGRNLCLFLAAIDAHWWLSRCHNDDLLYHSHCCNLLKKKLKDVYEKSLNIFILLMNQFQVCRKEVSWKISKSIIEINWIIQFNYVVCYGNILWCLRPLSFHGNRKAIAAMHDISTDIKDDEDKYPCYC